MNKLNFLTKQSGDPLEALEWNQVVSKIDELVESENGGGTPVVVDPSGILSTSGKGNVTLGSTKNINLEPVWSNNVSNYSGNWGDIALKPGDDILFCSHHREPKKRDKIVIKNIDGSDNPVKLLVVAGELDLAVGTTSNPKIATKAKSSTTGEDLNTTLFKSSDAKTLDLRILTGTTLDKNELTEREERGYLKVRAQAIDLRCEKHGGIALLPKGYDSDGNMNKIKFEHGGGDGLEFGTFNSEKTSIFTDEYRFNKNGIWKMATREKEASGKTILDECEVNLQSLGKTATGAYKYKKNNAANNLAKSLADLKTYEAADDFYDFIDTEDVQTTTEAIIKTAAALNNDYVETSLSSKKNLKISTSNRYNIVEVEYSNQNNEIFEPFYIIQFENLTKDDLKLIINNNNQKLSDFIGTNTVFMDLGGHYFVLKDSISPKISLESEEEVDLDAKYGDVVITSGDTIKCEAPEIRLNAIDENKNGGIVNFGATQDVIFLTNKLTKSLNVESATNPSSIKLMLLNNYQETVYWDKYSKKFIIPVKTIFIDTNFTPLTPDNYAEGLSIYFEDGTLVPADYTCFIEYLNNDITYIYKIGTKGNSAVLKKTLGLPVATLVGHSANLLGSETSNSMPNIMFEIPHYIPRSGDVAVAPGEFVSIAEVLLLDIITLVDYFKTGAGYLNGPWHD